MLYGFPDNWFADLESSQFEALQGTAQSVTEEGVTEGGSNWHKVLFFVCILSGKFRQTKYLEQYTDTL
jgi:hypothetical protein